MLRLITRLNVGGPARHALLLTRDLGPEYDTILAAGAPGANEGELHDPAVPVHRVPLVRQISAGADLRALDATRRLLSANRPRILHTHTAKAGFIGRLAALSMASRPLIVHTFHGHVLHGYFERRTERNIVAAEAWLAKRTDVLIAVSTEVRDELLDRGVGRPGQFEVVPLGLELDAYLDVDGGSGVLRERLGISPQAPLVGVVGRLVPVKDHETLLAAMVRLPGVHLAVIGDGERRAFLEGEVRRLGLADRVHFTGWWQDVAAAVSDLDVVVLTSKNEGTPVALIEASAAARPIVATAVGGVPAVVEDGVTGHLVTPGDDEAVALRLRELLDDRDRARHMGLAGRKRVRGIFGAERLLHDVRRIYASLLGGARGRV